MLSRSFNGSRTLELLSNYAHGGVYILHGDADRNVPVNQARFMREQLAEFHPNWSYYEKAGAGHWWGNPCVDWPPLFAFLRQNELPDDKTVRELEFATINPRIAHQCHWLRLEAQERWMEKSSLKVRILPKKKEIGIQSDNVSRFSLDVEALAGLAPEEIVPGSSLTVSIEGSSSLRVSCPELGKRLRFTKNSKGTWEEQAEVLWEQKGPHRAGPLKDAFRRQAVLVYATGGTKEENLWAFQKARYDAEEFRSKANGSFEVISDRSFLAGENHDRNVILYGHQDCHLAWSELLAESAPSVRRGKARFGDQERNREDLACLFVYPRKGSERASVGVISGTGIVGMRLSEQLPIFLSGAGFPDWLVVEPTALLHGSKGVLGAGFFDRHWEFGDEAWRNR